MERWDAVWEDLSKMNLRQVRSRWLLPLFSLLDFEPLYLRGDIVLHEGGDLLFSPSLRGWAGETTMVSTTVSPGQDLDAGKAPAGTIVGLPR